MHALRRGILAMGVPLLVTARAAAQRPVERDSAGIRIVENPSRAGAPATFRLGPRVMDLGGPADNPNDEFGRGLGQAALRLSDSLVVVTDVVRLQFLDGRGGRAGMYGRSGPGPQEFRSLQLTPTAR